MERDNDKTLFETVLGSEGVKRQTAILCKLKGKGVESLSRGELIHLTFSSVQIFDYIRNNKNNKIQYDVPKLRTYAKLVDEAKTYLIESLRNNGQPAPEPERYQETENSTSNVLTMPLAA